LAYCRASCWGSSCLIAGYIEANPDKVKAIKEMRPPRNLKFEWTPEADKAFAKLKKYLTSPPIMVAPTFREPLLLYIAVTLRTSNAVLIAERDAKVIAKEKIDPP
jgi:hypothetical protein